MFATILDIINWCLIALLSISVVLLIYKIFYHVYGLMPAVKFPEAKKNHRFAVLIPARYESSVIEGILKSLQEQDYPKELIDAYVIVESPDDPTIEICKKYENVTPFVRPDLKVKSKGGALDHILKHLINTGIAKEKGYEAYFIFDADNTLKSNFFTEMNKTFDAGYELAISYRNAKNWNDGWISSCSALTFSMVNTFQNKCRARFNQNVLVSGTGFYIAARVLHELGGWPFQTLTEDAEISNYAVLNGIKGAYNENTEHFDEQPLSLKVSWNQRIRWIKGHMQVTKKYSKQLLKSSLYSKENRFGRFEFGLSIIPIAIPLATIIIYCLLTLIMGIVGASIGVDAVLWQKAFKNFGFAILGIYVFLMCYTAAMVIAEYVHHKINLKPWNAVKTIILNPLFMGTWLPIALVAILKKEVTWKRIDRKADSINKTNYSNLIVSSETTDKPKTEELSKTLDAEFIKK